MMNLSYEEILGRIKKETGKSDEEIEEKVKEKLNKLGDLISKEGAIYIVANDLKIKIFDAIKRELKINKLLQGMNSVDVIGKVINVYDVREFKTEKREGKIGNFLIGDESGTAKVVMWDTTLIKKIEDGKIKVDDVVKIKNAYIKDNNGFMEIHMGNRATIEDCDEEINVNYNQNVSKKDIKDLQGGENVEITGTIVQVFEPRFYDGCTECRRKVFLDDGKYKCDVHGDVERKVIPVLNFYLDDSSGNIRVVSFGDNVSQIVSNVEKNFDELKDEVLGKQVKVNGKVNKNEMFNRLEMMSNNIEDVNPEELAKNVLNEVKK
ncbi:MAG: hypothetical protein KJ674_03105 [Nanoarchaeota archaeon]|nr:hypothetical protein [Nanoarchaeota archaeon]